MNKKKTSPKRKRETDRANVAVDLADFHVIRAFAKSNALTLRFILKQAIALWREKNGVA